MIDRSPIQLCEQLMRIHTNHTLIERLERDRKWRQLGHVLAEIHDATRKAESMVNDIIYERDSNA